MKKIKLVGQDGSSTVLDELINNNVYINADCNGKGSCGKCKVVIDNKVVLACQTRCVGDVDVYITNNDEGMAIESEIISFSRNVKMENRGGFATCIDIGTTTLAVARVDLTNSEIISQSSRINHQRIYGADVISRIQAANNGKLIELQKFITEDIKALLEDVNHGEDDEIIVSGNTTMEHLLLGYPCSSLGVAPYTPVNISLQHNGNTIILPGISTFVGADIVSGIYALEMNKRDKISVMIDLGTNGEIAIGNREKMLVTSTAAGPAFEGGNISCGCASIPGAISKVMINKDKSSVIETIGGKAAIGICGTGVIDIAAQLLEAGLIDETGLLDNVYFKEGYVLEGDICFSQKDIREVQLAKSAIRAGLETLIKEYGASYDEIETMYLSGGFGKKIDIENACRIGLIPVELAKKTVATGNTSLAGTIKFAINDSEEDIIDLTAKCREISLAESREFNELYMENMYFE